MTIQIIASPLPGERVLGLSPGDAEEAALTWLRRPNVFPGRALTAATLQQRQQWQAGHVVQRASTWVAGIDNGMEVQFATDDATPGLDGVRVTVGRGMALSASGEDVVLQRPLSCRLSDVPVVAPPGFFVDGSGVGNSGPGGTLLPRRIGVPLGQLPAAALAALPAVGVLVLQPVQVDTANLDALDPCDRSAFDEGTAADPSGFEDWRIGDGVRLLWYVWPGEWRPLPLPEEPMQLRNAVAWTVFQAEAALARDDAMPWDAFGVPVALAAVHQFGPPQDLRPVWVDRASVARRGGRARDAHLRSVGPRLAADPRLPSLWQARIEQFAEQVAALDGADAGLLSVSFGAYLPPVGLLPRNCFDPLSQQSNFFPPQFDLDAAPVPVEQLDLAVRSSAGLAPLDLTAQESVRLLVPVPLAHWEPRLLIREVVDAEFQRTVDRHLLERARALGARQGLRNKAALLAHAMDGQVHSVPSHKDDATATEPESLSPWGEPPVGGGHRSALLAGLHQHLFYGAAPTFDVAAGESMFVWAYLDPDHPPRTLMLQWHAREPNGSLTWEHRAFWGEDSIPLGSAAVPTGHRRIGDLPTPGAWVMLTVPAASVGLEGRRVDGMAFTLQDGRAAFGLAGARTSNTWRKWFCNVLPTGVGIQGNEPWDLLSQNDLWAPFEPRNGVVPSLPVPLGQGAAEPPVEAPLRTPRSGFNVQYSAAAAWRGHSFELFDSSTGPGPLRLQLRGDQAIDGKLLCSVYLDEITPPRALFASLSLSVFGDEMGFSDHHVFWGEDHLAELAQAAPGMRVAPAQVLRAGALPQSSRWVQIEVPLPPEHESLAVYEIRLFAFGGVLAFSDITFGRPTPPATQTGGWTLAAEPVWPRRQRDGTLHAPMTPLLGGKVWLRNNLGVLTPTPSALIGTAQVYTDLMKETALARLSGHEQSQLLLRGLSGFADYLRRRIDRADDITDFGFAHMQVDMHRVRQVVMSTSDAARLAVSPALAAIARSDSALVVQDQIASYLGKVRAAAVQKTVAPAALAAPAPTARAVARVVEAEPVFTATATARAAGIATRARLITAPRAPLDIVYAQPVIGLSEVRTTAIAERLRQPPSTEARDYALANRQRTVRSLLELLQTFMAEDGGSVPALLKDFEIPGLESDPFLEGAVSRRRKLADFLANAGLLGKLLSPPPVAPGATAADEASLFTQTVALSDNTIAVLRQLEGRLAVYREALARCDAAVAALLADIAATQQGLGAAEDALAEARHDVSVARALLAEETQRVADINTRRSRVLAEEVKFLAYIRPRETDNLRPVPTHAVDPALVEAPVPACLRDHPDLAEELLDMLSVVREAPANWFVKLPVLMQRLDRVEYLQRSLQTAQVRVAAGLAVPRSIVPPSASKLGQAAARVSARQAEALAPRHAALQALDLALLSSATWKSVQVQAQQVLSFGDLAAGTHGRSDVAQAAAAELHGIRSIVACLHAEFCGIPPALRLAWAETLSEFDEAPSLRNLASLPRWSELDSIDRRQMQAYVDWLFGQIEPNQPQAVALVNDVVRMCLLLASHAPVDRIVSGRLARPVTGVSPGIRIPLRVLDAAPVRVGMQAVLYRGDVVVARAVVEDLGSLEVSAHVIHTATARVDLGDDVRVHFDDAAMLSLKAAGAKRTLFGR